MSSYEFDEKGFAIKADENGKSGYINQKFDWIIPSIYNHILKPFGNHDYSTVLINLTDDNKIFKLSCGIIDRKGKWVLPPDNDILYYYNNTNIIAIKNGRYGILDIGGNWVINQNFQNLTAFDIHDKAIANFNGKWGVLNRKSEWIIEPQYDAIENYFDFLGEEFNIPEHFDKNQYIRVKKDGKWGIIDINNNYIFEPAFDYIFNFSDKRNIAIVSINGKYGMIDTKGNILIQPLYKTIKECKDDRYLFVQTINLKWGVFDNNGKQLIYPIYDDLSFIEEDGLLKATIGSKYGFMDIDENWSTQPTLDLEDVEVVADVDYFHIQECVRHYFMNDKVIGLHCLEDIKPITIDTFNQNLELNFSSNIEYLFFCDESLDSDYTSGIAIIKIENNYFLIWKGFKQNLIIFSMNSTLADNHILEIHSDKKNCEINIISNSDNTRTSHKINCYNMVVLNNFENFYRNLAVDLEWDVDYNWSVIE